MGESPVAALVPEPGKGELQQRQVAGPVADRAVPALGEAFALGHVVDEQVADPGAAVVGDQRPLVGSLLGAQRVLVREDA